MLKLTQDPTLLKDLMESLGQAEGGCSQMVHTMNDPRWIILREAINETKCLCLRLAEVYARGIRVAK